MLELLHGFKPHENVLKAHEICAENKISSVREESSSSHANQGCNQLAAKTDQKNAAESL